MLLLKKFELTGFPDGYQISPGAIAAGPDRIYIPAINTTSQKSNVIIYDYGKDYFILDSNGKVTRDGEGNLIKSKDSTNGERKFSEEFNLKYTEGIIYGGSTFYGGSIWTVSDEQVENEFTGCVENYSTEGEKIQNIPLPWMWGQEDSESFQCLGITIEENSFYILTKRTGWFGDEKLDDDYRIEKYDISGKFEKSFELDTNNLNPVGLTDNEELFFVGDVVDNELYSYNSNINHDDTQDIDLESDNEKAHGVGYNGSSFSILRYRNSSNTISPYIFIYGECDVIPDTPTGKSGVRVHGASLITQVNKVFGGLGKYGRNFKIEKKTGGFHQWCYPDTMTTFESVEMFQGSAVDFLTSTNLENKLFKTTDYLKFIPKYTLPGLELGDIIVDDGHDSNQDGDRNDEGDEVAIPSRRFEIIDLKEIANGQFQAIYTQRVS